MRIKQNSESFDSKLSDDDQLNTAESAKFLGLGEQTLCNWRFKRIGPPYIKYSPRKVSYLVRDLREYRDRNRIDPEAQR